MVGFGNKGGIKKRVRDEQGHYERWPEVRVMPDLDTAARAFLSDPACEEENMAELIRVAVSTYISNARVSNPRTKSVISILKAVEEENRQMQMRRRFKQHIEETAKEAFELVGEGRMAEAAQHVYRVLMHVREIPETDPWRLEFESALKAKFGYLLKMTKAASFLPDLEEEEAGLGKAVKGEAEWRNYRM